VDVSVGAGGVDVRTQSLVALLAGGLAFETPSFAPQVEPAAANTAFTLYHDQTTAMKQPEPIAKRYVLYFNESLRGLSVGAPVTLLGLPGGEVMNVGLDLDPATSSLRGRVEVVFFPERLIERLAQKQISVGDTLVRGEQERHAFVQQLVEQRGLRAQMRSGSLLTGQLYVALDYFPNAPKTTIDWSQDPTVIPVVPSTVQDIEARLTSIAAKLDKLPYEAIGTDLTTALATLAQTLKSADKMVNRLDTEITPGLKTTLDGLHGTLITADGMLKNTNATLVGTDAPAQQELRDALQEITRAARSLRLLADFLERHPESLLRGKSKEKP
jgi:paraquat-inducible protein B